MMPRLTIAYAILCLLAVWGAAPASAQHCTMDKVAEIPLGYSNGMPTVSAKINGVPVLMGIDTGAQTLVTPDTATRAHLARDFGRGTRAIGTTGISIVKNVELTGFEFAGRRFGPKSVASIALPRPTIKPGPDGKTPPLPPPLDGLIGVDILSDYDIDFDLAGKSITLYKIKGCTKITPPWTEAYTPFSFKLTAQRNIGMPVEVEGEKFTALLDTGSTSMAISRRAALKSGITEAMLKADPADEVAGVGAIVTKQPAHRFKTLVIAGETFRDLPMRVLDTHLRESDILVGQTYLISRRVWISYATHTLLIRAPKLPPGLVRPNTVATTTPSVTAAPAVPCLQYNTDGTCRAPVNAGASAGVAAKLASLPQHDRIASSRYVKKPEGYIGMDVVALSPAARLALGVTEENPLLVVSPIPNGPADAAGVKAGDVIVSFDGSPILGAASFQDMVKFKGSTYRMQLSILRQGQRLTLTVPLGGQDDAKRLREEAAREAIIERQIADESDAIVMFLKLHAPLDRAAAQLRLANALRQRTAGDSIDNLNRAVDTYTAALQSISYTMGPAQWAAAQHGLGAALRARAAKRGGEDLEHAVQALEVAYAARVKVGSKAEIAETALELGVCYAEREQGTRAENHEKATTYLKRAAEYYDAKWYPAEFTLLQQTLNRVSISKDAKPDEQPAAPVNKGSGKATDTGSLDRPSESGGNLADDPRRHASAGAKAEPALPITDAVQECDVLAGSPFDPERVGPGVPFRGIDTERATAACEAAVAAYPDIRRLRYQLARSTQGSDPTRAAALYEKLAADGYAPAMVNLAQLYARGQGKPQNYPEAARLVQAAATPAFPFGFFILGTYYRQGIALPLDKNQAALSFRKAADLGIAEALFALSDMYIKSEIHREPSEAAFVYREAANRGNAQAAFHLGLLLESGLGVAVSKVEAVHFFEMASNLGSGEAANHLAEIYEKGDGVTADGNQALRLYKRAADLGFSKPPVAAAVQR